MPYTLIDGTILPSVTEILAATETKTARQRLIDWERDNPGVRDAACDRGTYVHALCASYLLQEFPRRFPNLSTEPESIQAKPPHASRREPPAGSAVYFRGLIPTLSDCGPALWAEHEVGGAGNQFVWSSLGYAGRPDALVQVRGELVLIDLKTATSPYHAAYKGDGSAYARFCKATTQLAGYAQAVEETLGVKPDKQVVLVAMEQGCQVLQVSTAESTKAEKRWRNRLEKYQRMHGRASECSSASTR